MKRLFSFLLVMGLMASFFCGCSGKDGATGPAGPPGTPQPIKVLVLGAESESNLKNIVAGIYSYGAFPLGTTVDYADIRTAAPALATLRQYNVAMVHTNSTTSVGTAVGDVLADYVDAGGKVVALEYSFFTATAIGGRFMTDGYCPFRAAAGAGIAGSRTIAFNSISYPLHPIFNGTDPRNISFFANGNTPNPGLDPTAILIALDSQGANAIAINAGGTVIAMQICGAGSAWNPETYPYSGILVCNACLFLAGAF